MPASHSKRNTSLAFFTSHERSELRNQWGTRTSRLTRDSFLPFASCNLCLAPGEDPVACALRGDVFCRACIVSNLVAQRGAMKRAAAAAEQQVQEREHDAKAREQEEEERRVREFERAQAGLHSAAVGRTDKRKREGERESENGNGKKSKQESHAHGGTDGGTTKEKGFTFDALAATQRTTLDERQRARSALDDEAARREKLPSFWVPSLTPVVSAANASPIAPAATETICPCSDERAPHALSLKSMVALQFTLQTGTETGTGHKIGSKVKVCPACSKPFGAGTKATLAVPCGHVVCKSCTEKFVTNPEVAERGERRCYVCDADLRPGRDETKDGRAETEKKKKRKKEKTLLVPGLVDIRSEGTGFASGGKNVVAREGVVFQC